MTGPDILVVGDADEIPGVAPNAPMLQYATQLFIKTSLGIQDAVSEQKAICLFLGE